jgi:hypothetical protein
MDLFDEGCITYQNDIQHSYMVMKLKQSDEIIEYQVRMLQENPIRQLLPLHKKQIDTEIYFFYDITSKIALNQLLKRIKVNKHEFLSMLRSLITGLRQGNAYLLQGGSFLLHSDYIYVDPATLELSIVYLPIAADSDINEGMKAWLMDLIIYKTSFEPPDQGDFVYELLNLIKSESFSLNQLDKAIGNLALQQSASARGVLEEPVLQSKVQNAAARAKEKKQSESKNLIFILLQVFFAAITVMMTRYIYLKAQNAEITTLLGIVLIALAVDAFTIKRLGLISKPSIPIKDTAKPEKINKFSFRIGKKTKMIQPSKVRGTEYAAVLDSQPFISPRDYETMVLLDEMDHWPYLLGIGENNNEMICIDKSSFIIGRLKAQSDYISRNSAVGKLHAEISTREDAYYIKDLNSRNGTYVNGERIASNVEYSIQNNDRISFANSEYKFMRSERADHSKKRKQ